MHRNHNHDHSPKSSLIAGIFAVCFGIFWTIMAGSIFPPMAIFGILWTAFAVTKLAEGYKNMNKEQEKPKEPKVLSKEEPQEIRCPYCGAPVHKDDESCEYCDSRL